MKKILVTGGPVHAHLDDVKIITNRFKGGLMVKLAEKLADDNEVIYLTAVGAKLPEYNMHSIRIHNHTGFEDYRERVREYSGWVDAVVLGAAVANLIPLNRIKGKFPSHNYKPGDVIPIDFTIAPRVIDDVKNINPKVHLFGFKLLSNAIYDELIRAAYEVLLGSKADAVFANDTKSLLDKFIVTKERGVHPASMDDLVEFINTSLEDKFYSTDTNYMELYDDKLMWEFFKLKDRFKDNYSTTPEGFVFGTIAVRSKNGSFLTTTRGKRELDKMTYVKEVDHETLKVKTLGTKASLNAPLLSWLFNINPQVKSIIHYHIEEPNLKTLPYAPPGTVRDSKRNMSKSFNIKNHGCFLLLNENDEVIV